MSSTTYVDERGQIRDRYYDESEAAHDDEDDPENTVSDNEFIAAARSITAVSCKLIQTTVPYCMISRGPKPAHSALSQRTYIPSSSVRVGVGGISGERFYLAVVVGMHELVKMLRLVVDLIFVLGEHLASE